MSQISDVEFQLFKRLINTQAGIHLKDCKKTMVANRLRKRLDFYGLNSYKKYYDFITKMQEGRHEIHHFVNALTTNKTHFFRHREHFNTLFETILPVLHAEKKKQGSRTIRIWSAACSSGEEPYSIAIQLYEKKILFPNIKFEIIGSDINTQVIENARKGEYLAHSIATMPKKYLYKYLKYDAKTTRYILDGRIKQMVKFHQHNLLNNILHGKFDIVLCRNVLIYFNRESKLKVLSNINEGLLKGGYLIMGYSESLLNIQKMFTYMKPTVYFKGSLIKKQDIN